MASKSSLPALPGPQPVIQRTFDFSGGLNVRLVNNLLHDNELIELDNGFFDIVGAIKKRGGSEVFATIAHPGPIQTLYRFYPKSPEPKHFLWATVNGTLGKISDDGLTETDLSTTLGTSQIGFFTTALNTAIYTNGVAVPQAITSTGGILSIAPLGGTPPVSRYAVFHKGRLFLAGDPTNPSRIVFSNSGTIDVYSPTDFIDFGQDDGSIITGMIVQFDTLVIFKENSIYTLDGDNTTNFIVKKQQAAAGCIAPKTLQTLNGIIFYLGRQGSRLGVYTFINGIVTRISQNIDPALQNASVPAIQYSAGFVDFPYYYVSVPIMPSTVNNEQFVFDSSINAWSHFINWNANIIASWPGGNDLGFIFYGDSITSDIVQMFVGYLDQGKFYNFSIATKYFDYQVQELVKVNKIFYLTKESTWPTTGIINYDIDFANNYTGLITPTPQGWHVFNQSAQGQFISIRFTDFSANAIKLTGFTLMAEQWQVRPR